MALNRARWLRDRLASVCLQIRALFRQGLRRLAPGAGLTTTPMAFRPIADLGVDGSAVDRLVTDRKTRVRSRFGKTKVGFGGMG